MDEKTRDTRVGRNGVACDQCHAVKMKCVPEQLSCRRCIRKHIGYPTLSPGPDNDGFYEGLQQTCKYGRTLKKRGKKPRLAESPSSHAEGSSDSVCRVGDVRYPVLDSLSAFGIREESPEDTSDWICTPWTASRLLEHFYESPNQEVHTRIIRKRSLLHLQTPRLTSPALLSSILCISCYMSGIQLHRPEIFPHRGVFRLVRRKLYDVASKLMASSLTKERSFDDAVTMLMLTYICQSEDATQTMLPQWLSSLKFVVQQLNLNLEPCNIDEEGKEERRRLWWAAYILDRHTAFSQNMLCQLQDQHCQQLQRPIPDRFWESSEPLPSADRSRLQGARCGSSPEATSQDFFGVFIGLSSILGHIINYRSLQLYKAFNQQPQLLDTMRKTIEDDLINWRESLRHLLEDGKSETRHIFDIQKDGAYDETTVQTPIRSLQLVYYGMYILHTLYIVLYGKMDLKCMYDDVEWQGSAEFVAAGDHSMVCATLGSYILGVDPHLEYCYRYFGTYMLQSSFIFYILIRKFGRHSSEHIRRTCLLSVKALDSFVKTVDMKYQRIFARAIRQAIEDAEVSEFRESNQPLDPEILKFRWIPGFNGLWDHELGRPEEARNRKFPNS